MFDVLAITTNLTIIEMELKESTSHIKSRATIKHLPTNIYNKCGRRCFKGVRFEMEYAIPSKAIPSNKFEIRVQRERREWYEKAFNGIEV
jgi:hypothetical protein